MTNDSDTSRIETTSRTAEMAFTSGVTPAWPWWTLAGVVLLTGGGLGWYLVARVYRPVQWLERPLRAARRT